MTPEEPKVLATPTRLERAIVRVLAPRMAAWLWVSLILLVAVWWFAEHMLKVLLYKGVIITLAAFLGDKIVRAIETRNRRPHELLEEATALRSRPGQEERAWQLEQLAHGIYYRRALVIGACVIAGALGS